MNLGLTLTQSALKWPEKTALVFEGRNWTYRDWNREVNQAANAFAGHGIGRGDRVAFLWTVGQDAQSAVDGLEPWRADFQQVLVPVAGSPGRASVLGDHRDGSG